MSIKGFAVEKGADLAPFLPQGPFLASKGERDGGHNRPNQAIAAPVAAREARGGRRPPSGDRRSTASTGGRLAYGDEPLG